MLLKLFLYFISERSFNKLSQRDFYILSSPSSIMCHNQNAFRFNIKRRSSAYSVHGKMTKEIKAIYIKPSGQGCTIRNVKGGGLDFLESYVSFFHNQ